MVLSFAYVVRVRAIVSYGGGLEWARICAYGEPGFAFSETLTRVSGV